MVLIAQYCLNASWQMKSVGQHDFSGLDAPFISVESADSEFRLFRPEISAKSVKCYVNF